MGGHSKCPFEAADRELAREGFACGKGIAENFIEMMNIRRTNRFSVPFYKAIIERLSNELEKLKGEDNG